MGYCIGEEISGLKTIYKKSVSDRNKSALKKKKIQLVTVIQNNSSTSPKI